MAVAGIVRLGVAGGDLEVLRRGQLFVGHPLAGAADVRHHQDPL
jgi:hypothetical protein